MELRNSTTAVPLVSAGTVMAGPSLPAAMSVPAVVVKVTLRLSISLRGSSWAVIVAREIPSAGRVVEESVTRRTWSARLGPST